MKILLIYRVCLTALLVIQPLSVLSQEVFEAAQSPGVEAEREPGTVYLNIEPEVKSPVVIPRLAAPLNSMRWSTPNKGKGLRLVPKQETWEIHWDHADAGRLGLTLHFDENPYLLSELRPIWASGDGSFMLPAHRAVTRGENIRYEPQPHKNTIGYWTGKEDSATWSIKLDKPGRFNVAVLQGCGKGQGGSKAMLVVSMRVDKPVEAVHEFNPVEATLDFEVIETGHWQNFQWRQLGVIELQRAGELDLTVMPKEIKKAALMDIRAIHLIRLPDKKK